MKCLVQPGDGAMPLIKGIKDARKSVEIVIFRFNRSEIEKSSRRRGYQGGSCPRADRFD